jgi:hypothetical protein
VTGLTRTHAVVVNEIAKVIDTKADEILFGLTMLLARGRNQSARPAGPSRPSQAPTQPVHPQTPARTLSNATPFKSYWPSAVRVRFIAVWIS